VKTSPALEKPRFVILGFQTNRQNKKNQKASQFDHAKFRDVKLYFNSQCYPYANLNLDITNSLFFSTCIPTSDQNTKANKSRSFPEVNFENTCISPSSTAQGKANF